MKVVKCETNDLKVPANLKIVFEGTIDAHAMGNEGSLGEMHGYCFKGATHKVPLINVNAITHRKITILSMCASSRYPDETQTIACATVAAAYKFALRNEGLPYWTSPYLLTQ